MDRAEAQTRLLDSADELFYGNGIQAVGIDAVRSASGVALKRLYQCYPSKEALVIGYLERRDRRWRHELREDTTRDHMEGRERVLAVFDSLERWFGQPDFRGCAFINAFGELGASSEAIAEVAREHKAELLAFLAELASDAGVENPLDLARQLLILVDGAIVSAALTKDPRSARWARSAAATLIDAGGDVRRHEDDPQRRVG